MTNPELFEPEMRDKKTITLSDIIDTTRNLPEEYKRLIHGQEQRKSRRLLGDNFTIFGWEKVAFEPLIRSSALGLHPDEFKRGLKYFRDRLSQELLIDLGGGEVGSMQAASSSWQVGTYINVDRSVGGSENVDPDPTKTITAQTLTPGTYAIDVNADMLEFVTKLKDGIGNFTINGIDEYIINNHAYNKCLAIEIVRATKPRGLIFGICSGVSQDLKYIAATNQRLIRMIDTEAELGFNLGQGNSFIFEKME